MRQEAKSVAAAAAPGGAIRDVLVVDDSRLQRRILKAMLSRWGFRVREAASGGEALALCRGHPPDLVLSDWMMPGMTGLAFCRAFRAERVEGYGYFILLTSKGEKDEVAEGLDAGADDFLTKPVDMDELTARLRVAERVLALQTEVQLMQKLLPICMYCGKIRDKEADWEDQSSWQDLESYVAEKTDVQFSHGICKDCYETRVEPELGGSG